MSTGTQDYYTTLGVDRTASESEIKKAFRRKARECHPDVNCDADAEERFKALNEAYDVLSDPRKRDIYDTYGTVDPRAAGPDIGDIFQGFGMDDIFSAFFGGAYGSGSRIRPEGRDMAVQMTITLEEAASGVDKEVVIDRLAPCEECASTGSASRAGAVTCVECRGSGQHRVQRRTFIGVMETLAPCDRCSQTGAIVEDPCEECRGSGRVPDRQRITVEVPAGIADGMQLRMRGAGEAGVRGAAAGDLLVTVRVAPHEYLHRQGDDLHCKATISVTQALLGTEMTCAGIEGDVSVKVPAGTQHGDAVRVKGAGMPRVGSGSRGDLIAHIAIDVPRKLTKRQRELVEELAGHFGDGAVQRTKLDRIKDWLSG